MEAMLVPLFEPFAEDRVIGVAAALLGCLDGIFPRKFIVFHEDADELSDDKSWVCVIDLQTHLVAEIGEIFVIAQMSSEDVLQ